MRNTFKFRNVFFISISMYLVLLYIIIVRTISTVHAHYKVKVSWQSLALSVVSDSTFFPTHSPRSVWINAFLNLMAFLYTRRMPQFHIALLKARVKSIQKQRPLFGFASFLTGSFFNSKTVCWYQAETCIERNVQIYHKLSMEKKGEGRMVSKRALIDIH